MTKVSLATGTTATRPVPMLNLSETGAIPVTTPEIMPKTFPRLTDIPVRRILDGTIRGHYAHATAMTIGEVLLDANTVVPMHDHPHEQLTYVIEGQFQFRVGDETTILEPGMVALIPAGVKHGGTTLTACRVIDVFSPIREDYR